MDRLEPDDIFLLLTTGRKDASGDFTKGADLTIQQTEKILRFLDILPLHPPTPTGQRYSHTSPAHEFGKDESYFRWLADLFRENLIGSEGIAELKEISRLAKAAGYEEVQIKIDPSVVRGLEYYTGPVYEVELLLDTKDEKGRPVRFGSVGGGGRYDGLVSRFRGEPVPATGFSIGVSRLQAALTMLGNIDTKPEFGPVVVTVFGGEIAGYQKMVAALRNANIRAELYLGNPKHSLGQQMKYADRRNSPCAIIQGSDEKANGKIQIKDLILGAGLAEIKDREEYLKKQAEAQYEVDEDRIVEAVREVLARHGVKWG